MLLFEGYIKFRGTKKNIINFLRKNFLKESFKECLGSEIPEYKKVIFVSENNIIQNIEPGLKLNCFKKSFLINNAFPSLQQVNDEDYVAVCRIIISGNVELQELQLIASEYNIDVKGHLTNKDTLVDLDFEVLRDNIVKSYIHTKYKSIDDFLWYSIHPSFGGY